MNTGLGPLRRPIRIVLQWQAIATVGLALAGGFLAGNDAAFSAVCGGAVSMIAGAVSAAVAARGKARSAGGVLIGALRAEATRIGVMALLLWLVLATYDRVVPSALFGSFLATAVIFTMAFFVREQD